MNYPVLLLFKSILFSILEWAPKKAEIWKLQKGSMKSTSKILLNKITDETVISILRSIVPILNEFEVEYFIIGAFARDIQLFEKGHTTPPTEPKNQGH